MNGETKTWKIEIRSGGSLSIIRSISETKDLLEICGWVMVLRPPHP